MTQPIPQGYKQTEIGVIPEDWEVCLLESVCKEIGDGIHSTPVYSLTGKFFFINGNNINNGKITVDENTQKVDESEFLKHGKKLSDSSILLSINGTIGNLAFFDDEQLVLGKSAAYLTVKDKFSKHFVYYSLQTKSTKRIFEDGLTGSTIKNLGLSTIRQTIIPIPKREEQTAIATALSDVDALISGLESLIAKKQAIKTATMQQLLTGKTRLPQFAHHPDGTAKGYQQTELGLVPEDWEVRNLGEVAHINMGQSPSSACYNVKAIGLPLVQGNADITNRKTIVRNYTSQITKTAKKGDLILSVRAPVGEIAKADFDCCIGRGVCSLKYKNDYLYHWLIGFETEWDKFSKGSTFDSINSDELRLIQLILPSDEEQTAIATILSDMDEEIQALETRLSKTKQIKQGMMQVLLTGKVRLV